MLPGGRSTEALANKNTHIEQCIKLPSEMNTELEMTLSTSQNQSGLKKKGKRTLG